MGKVVFRRAVSLLLLAPLLAAAPAAGATRGAQVTVMSWNVYADIDLGPLIVTPPGPKFDELGGSILSGLEARDPEGRMKLIADEIARVKPDVVGLQEVPLWRTGPSPANTVTFDFLATIRSELARKQASYRVATARQPFDLEFPTDRGFDARITFGDVMLVKSGVKVTHARSRILKTEQAVQTQAIGVMHRPRMTNELDAVVRGVRFHVVNTHLEPRDPEIRALQAKEVVKGSLRSRLPTILLGDLNSGPTRPEGAQRKAYQVLADAGFKESGVPKFTCCFADLVGGPGFNDAPDHIMARPRPRVVRSFHVGSKRTPTGFHPSDHAGLVAVLRLRMAAGRTS